VNDLISKEWEQLLIGTWWGVVLLGALGSVLGWVLTLLAERLFRRVFPPVSRLAKSIADRFRYIEKPALRQMVVNLNPDELILMMLFFGFQSILFFLVSITGLIVVIVLHGSGLPLSDFGDAASLVGAIFMFVAGRLHLKYFKVVGDVIEIVLDNKLETHTASATSKAEK